MVAGLFLSFPIFTRNRFLLFSKQQPGGFTLSASRLLILICPRLGPQGTTPVRILSNKSP